MARPATERVTRGLRWTGLGLLVAGALVVIAGIGFTRSIEALQAAAAIAVIAFGGPGAAAFGLAFWLEYTADRVGRRRRAAARSPAHDNPFREPLRRYAIGVAAVLAAWAARVGLDAYIPDQVPFITFYLAIAVSGWIGGFVSAALATFGSAIVAGFFYVKPDLASPSPDVGRYVLIGLFVLVGLGITAIMSTLHEALARSQQAADGSGVDRLRPAAADNRLLLLVQSAPAALFLTDRQFACTFCNAAWLALRGRTLTQELGHGWWEGVHPEDLALRREAFAEAFLRNAEIAVDYRLRQADGKFRRVRDNVAVCRDGQGFVVGLVGACMMLPQAEADAGVPAAGADDLPA